MNEQVCRLFKPVLDQLNEDMSAACQAGDYERANAIGVAGDMITVRLVRTASNEAVTS